MSHQLSPPVQGYVDRRRSYKSDDESHLLGGVSAFTCNAVGTTTTAVGANATPSTNANVIRIGEEFKIFNAAGAIKEEKIFTVTTVVVAASTTVTFSPAAAIATASTDVLRLVGTQNVYSNAEMDRRLIALGFTAARVATMTENDKMYQIRTLDDPGSI